MSEKFPRLLVATEFPPNGAGGGAVIARQMLRDWPLPNLFWWSCQPDRTKAFSQDVAGHCVATIPRKLYPNRRAPLLKSWLLEHAWIPWAAGHFRQTLARLKPEVVWVIPHSWAIPPVGKVLPDSGIGFHVSVHDYPDSRSSIASFGAARCRLMLRGMESLYARADTRDAISDEMVADLRGLTGADGLVSHSGLEPEAFDYLAQKREAQSDTIRIAFAGTIGHESTFALFSRAVAAVRSRLPKPVSIEIFSTHSYADRPWFDGSWMRERGNLAEPEFSRALREFTWGFCPTSLGDPESSTRFSLPTKFTNYLATGLAVFTLADPEASVIRVARNYRVGVYSTSTDLEELKGKVLEAFTIENPWTVFGSEIVRCARAEMDATKLRRALYDCFHQCAEKSSTSAKA